MGSKDSNKAAKEDPGKDQPQTIVPFANNAASGPAESEVAVPVDDGRYIRFGLWFLLLTLGTFTLWATLAPLGSAIVSSGEVVVDSYRKSIQHYEGGIVQNIFVRNGDRVEAGDALIQLETIQSQAEFNTKQKQLFTAQAELERLMTEQRFEEHLEFSGDLLAEADRDPDIQSAVKQQQQLHTARLKAFNQEQLALDSRIKQVEQQIRGLQKQKRITLERLASLNKEEKAYATLFEEGLADGQRARELSRLVLSTENEIARFDSEISRLRIQITETDLQIATRKQDFLKDVGERIKELQTVYYDLKEVLDVSVDRVERSTIRAPEDGVVVDLQVHTIGSVAPPGQTLLDLVPEQDSFVVEARLMTQDINDVYQGQLADIRFSAFQSKQTKVVEGEVAVVSADRLVDESNGNAYYLVRIKLTEKGRADMTSDMVLKPGMPAEVLIKREERTLSSYLIKPIADSFARSMKER